MKNNLQETQAQLNVLNEQQQKEKLNETITADDIDEVYRRMTRLYGHKFTSSYGDCDDGTWLMALQGLSKKDITRGMTEIMCTPNEWPPSVPKFKQLCLGVKIEIIKYRAKKLAIKDYGSFDFNRLTAEKCRIAVREMLAQATKEVMRENMIFSQQGILEEKIAEQQNNFPKLEVHQKELKP